MGDEAVDAEAVIASDALLHAALGSMPYGFTIWDERRRLSLWNGTYLEMYHLPAERIRKGMTLREIAEVSVTTGDHGEMTVDEIEAAYKSRFRHDAGAKVTEHRSGLRDIRTTNTRMPGLGWVVTHQDISDEVARYDVARAREEALARQNLRFDAAVNNMSHGLAMFGPDHRLVVCNDMFAEMYGLPPELVRPGARLEEIFAYRTAHGITNAIESLAGKASRELQQTEPHLRTIRFVEREGGRIISVIRQPMADGGWVSTHQDITEQRRKEELIQMHSLQLEIQNIRFDAAINNMVQGLAMYDSENRLIVCNRQYAEMYDLPADLTRAGTSFWDMLNDHERTGMVEILDRETRFRALSQVIAEGRAFKNNVKMENGRVVAVMHQPMKGGGWITTHEDVTEQHRNEEMIRHLARHDALTDLPNRVLFREEMAKLEGRIRRRESIAVLCIDLDRFKTVNDNFGHAMGDEVLVRVAKLLREASRESDVVARLGGDEFAILAGPLDDPRSAAAIADRIVRSLGEPMLVGGKQVVIGGSVGIAMAPIDGTDPDVLLRNADLALYRAKSEGRGAYHFFERGMDDALNHRRSLEAGLRTALAKGELRLVFQPLFNLAENRICSLEALLRWDHPDRGLIPPSEFIPIAEESGTIVAIGDWVLKEACRAAAAWPESIRIAVNLSAAQFRGSSLAGSVADALAETGLAPERLELEITESLLLADTEAFEVLHSLRAKGVRIAMDDFGTGYSSLSYLRSFPFDKIKIDRSFMTGLSGEGESLAIISAMIGLGRSLGMTTTAEGIETETQLEAVRSLGCQEVQGYLFSPPLPASGIDALLGAVRVVEARRVGAGA